MGQKVLINYTHLKDEELNEFTDHVIAEMTGNTDFPSPPWNMGHVQNYKTAFLTAVEKAKEGGNQETIDKNNKRKTLEDKLRDDANYVNITAKGIELKLAGSGFTLTDPPTPVGILDAPAQPELSTGDTPNILKVNVARNEKAQIYIYLYTPDPMPAEDNDWIKIEDTASSIVIENLQSGQKYWVKVAYKATEDTLRFSEPVSKIVQ